jgi:FkbM family methyltransferase
MSSTGNKQFVSTALPIELAHAPSMTEGTPPSLVLRTLRLMPRFRGKARIARKLLSAREKNRSTSIEDRYGNPMVVPNLVEPVGFSLAVEGSYEPELADLIRQRLVPDKDFVDVGANIGAFTVALADYARRVVAIEPSPAVLPFLRRNVELSHLNNVSVVDCAASAPGVDLVPFYVPPMDHFGMGSSAAQFGVDPLTIPARPLDRILRDYDDIDVAAIKIDVEGFEAHVLLGASELLHSRKAPFIAFEFCDWAEDRAFPGRKGWAQQILLDAGYKLSRLVEGAQEPIALAAPIAEGCHTIIGSKP